ncbi:hypothetical protein M758_6G034800 [Ceratodon purpureus]|uniref:Secreted protein n=1 Tax=Ceratodon purpureus TaxID=3225 RepID=A0A8T0HB83_CERPU|nr:hypothetical protein KC19_6G038000 [Ceratodon purpureus]KAG0612530.1 hypothetical protein M758_6G034800 [Ceratodon purpureus]
MFSVVLLMFSTSGVQYWCTRRAARACLECGHGPCHNTVPATTRDPSCLYLKSTLVALRRQTSTIVLPPRECWRIELTDSLYAGAVGRGFDLYVYSSDRMITQKRKRVIYCE